MQRSSFMAMMIVVALSFCATPAYAQLCETASSTENAINNTIIDNWKEAIEEFFEQEKNFIHEKLWFTARLEVLERIKEFRTNIPKHLSIWWADHFSPMWPPMAKQLHWARVDQTMAIGKLMDAEMMNEVLLTEQHERLKAMRRYMPSELSCQVDTVSKGMGQAQALGGSLIKSYGTVQQTREANTVGSVSARGSAAEQSVRWREYLEYFCDPRLGDVGCDTAGSLPGVNRNFADLLWGQSLSIDMTDEEQRFIQEASMRYLLSPDVNDPILGSVVESPQGRDGMLIRRAKQGRFKAIFNVLGRIHADRVQGAGVNTQDYRVNAGIVDTNASVESSYREIMEAMSRDRFQNPDYIAQMINEPEQLMREQTTINATRLQQLFDLYSRLEEMVFMEASIYADSLDQEIPRISSRGLPQ